MPMSNPLFKALGGQNQPDFIQNFLNFANQMQGVNARDEINRRVRSGAVTQNQLNAAQQKAQQMMNALSMLKR